MTCFDRATAADDGLDDLVLTVASDGSVESGVLGCDGIVFVG